MKRSLTVLVVMTFLLILSGMHHACFASSNILFILDSSGSMWGKVDNVAKITTAKKVLTGLLRDLPKDANVGLMAYGHRTKEDCKDVEVLAPISPNDPNKLAQRVDALQPKGKTPLTYSLAQSLPLFAPLKGQSNHVVLVSDGKETCGGDPCAAARKLVAGGVDLRVHVVGFDVSDEERKQLECIADQGKGSYFNAENTKGLEIALAEVKKEVVKPPPPPPPPPPPITGKSNNLLSKEQGGKLVLAPHSVWYAVNDDKTGEAYYVYKGQEAVFCFQDIKPATFDTFKMLIQKTYDYNIQEFELFVGDESPDGAFRSIGKFKTHNLKLMRDEGFQRFKFTPVTARYFKFKVLSTYRKDNRGSIYEFKLMGRAAQGQAPARTPAALVPPVSQADNLLSTENGGQLLVAPSDLWKATNDGKIAEAYYFYKGQEGIYTFKGEQPTTFNTVSFFVDKSYDYNIKEFELLAGNESITGAFSSIGKFTIQNIRYMATGGFQTLIFPPVTSRYVKIKLVAMNRKDNRASCYEIRLGNRPIAGQAAPIKPEAESPAAPKAAKKTGINLLSPENGGELLAAPHDRWRATNDGKLSENYYFYKNGEGVYGFKDEKAATFNAFSLYIHKTYDYNLQEFELLVGNESPMGAFRSIGKFRTQNIKLMKDNGFQTFTFPQVTAKYLKVRVLSSYRKDNRASLYEFRLWGEPAE